MPEGARPTPPALSRWLVHRYPGPWHERYETEMLALLEESHPRWRDVADLARGLAVERARALFEPGDRPWTTYILVMGLRLALGIAFILPAVVIGLVASYELGELASPVARAGQLVALIAVLAFWAQSIRASWPGDADTWAPPFSRRTGAAWLSTAFVGVLLTAWGPSGVSGWMPYLMVGTVASQQIASWRVGRVLGLAVRQLARSKHELKWAQMELERCEGLTAAGAAAPLAEARDAIVRIVEQRDEAVAMLHGMGYRARVAGGGP